MRYLVMLAVLVLGLGLAPRALAQIPVTDALNLAQNSQTAAQAVMQVEQLREQLQQLQMTYRMLTQSPNVMGMASGLQELSVENPMPGVDTLSGLVGGQTAPSGAARTYYNQNNVYTPMDGSQTAQQLIQNAQGIANIQGVASNNLFAVQQRLQELPELESALNAASSIAQVNGINGRIAAESQFVQGQQAQAANLQVLATEQQASQQQQHEEQLRQDADSLSADMAQAGLPNGGS